MANEIISYLEMCHRETASLQRGMNFGLGGTHSVILMSLRPNAPYADRLEDDGSTLIYEGHDETTTNDIRDPKLVDQPESTRNGTLTQNGRFHQAAQAYKEGARQPERVRVYEKSAREFGRTTEYFTWSIPGKSKTAIGRCLSLNSLL